VRQARPRPAASSRGDGRGTPAAKSSQLEAACLESAGVAAALANRTTFDGTDGNVDSPSRVADIATRSMPTARPPRVSLAFHASARPPRPIRRCRR
jgi:hypothetical protein